MVHLAHDVQKGQKVDFLFTTVIPAALHRRSWEADPKTRWGQTIKAASRWLVDGQNMSK
jgi:hypothetical protein